MTTIAFDGKILAADTAMISDGTKYRFTKKIRRLSDGRLAGFAGTISSGLKMMDWLDSDDPDCAPDIANDDSTCVLVVGEDGSVSMYDGGLVEMPVLDTIVAIGTGADMALGAMLAGASARKAVEIAIARDTNSGGDVMYLKL